MTSPRPGGDAGDGAPPVGAARRAGEYLAAALFLTLLYLGGALEFLEFRLIDQRFDLYRRSAGNDIVLVTIDSRSLKETGVWPWSRELHAAALERILAANPRRIAVTVDFSAASDPAGDRHLAEVLASGAGRVILPVFAQRGAVRDDNIPQIHTEPLPIFARHAELASVNLRVESDGVVRRAAARLPWRRSTVQGMAAAMVGAPASAPEHFYIDFGIDPGGFDRMSFIDIVAGRFDPARLAGRTVIIGAAAGELGDRFLTPLGPGTPGLVVQALAAESLLQGRALSRAPPLAGLAVMLAALLSLGWYCSRSPWQAGLVAGLVVAVGVAALAFAAQVRFAMLLDIAPALVALPLAYGLGLTRLITRQNMRLLAQMVAIRRKDTYVSRLLDTAFDGFIAVDEGAVVRSANRRAGAIFGFAPAALTGRPLDELIDPPQGADMVRFLSDATDAGGDVEVDAKRADGQRFQARLAMSRVPAEGERSLYILLLMDLTALRAAQADAAGTRRRLVNAIESIPEGIALWDQDDRLLTCNARFVEFHAPVAHLLAPGCPFDAFVRNAAMLGDSPAAEGREKDWITERMESHRRTGGSFQQQTADQRWLRVSERRTEAGEIITVETDVTEERLRTVETARARDAAEAASKAKTRFLAGISHEFRTPLNAILGFSGIIEENADQPRLASYARDIQKSGSRLLSMIDDILEMTRIDLGTEHLRESTFDLAGVVSDCVAKYDETARGLGVRLEMDVAPDLAPVRADRQKLVMALSRLLDNAVRHSPADASVRVGVREDAGGGQRISVADSGPGMTAQEIAIALRPFGRDPDPYVGEVRGLGLGLALADLEIRQLGGWLDLEGAPGNGLTATLSIPAGRVVTAD